MANATLSLLGTGTPFRLNDIGNGDLALATHSYATGQPLGANDRALGMFGINLPFRAFAIGDGGYALGTSQPVSAGAVGDASIPLFANGIPIRLVNMGDSTYTIGTVSQPTGQARASNDAVFPLPGSNLPLRWIRQSKGDYALCVSPATSIRPSADAAISLWGVNLKQRLVGMGDGTYALANTDYLSKILSVSPSNLIAFWPLNELTGPTAYDQSGNGRNGTYTAVTLGQTGVGDGGVSALFVPASSSRINVYSAGLASASAWQEWSWAIWMRVSGSGVWTDGSIRYCIHFGVDANNNAYIAKSSANNTMLFNYTAGGASKTVSATYSALTSTHFAGTISKAADAFKAYINGAQVGSTQTGLGTWSGALATTIAMIGALNSAGTQICDGFEAYAAVWSTPLTAAQILTLATIP